MKINLSRFLILLFALASRALAQNAPPPPITSISVAISPPTGATIISLTTNSVFVTVAGATNLTNLVVSGSFVFGTNTSTIRFNDGGVPPDATSGDGTFSGRLIAPFLKDWGTNLPVKFVTTGLDPNDTNVPPLVITNMTTNVFNLVARPENDNFTNAFKIPSVGGIIKATNNYASLEAGEPLPAGVATADLSVWWEWSTPFTTNVLIDLAGSSFNPVLAIYRGTDVGKLSLVAASTNDVVDHLKANVVFSADAGATYRIAIAGYDTNGAGNIRLRVVPGGHPDTNGPLVTILNPAADSVVTTNVVFVGGVAKDNRPDDTDVAAVFLRVGNAPPINAGTNLWVAPVTLLPGPNVISAYAVDIAGNFGPTNTIVLSFVNPINDNFADAIELVGTGGLIDAINGRATKEPGEPNHGGNDGGHSIWYTFRAPVDGQLTITTTTNSTFDTLIGVYTGSVVSNLTLVAGNDDAVTGALGSQVTANVAANGVYSIALDGYGGQTGSVEFTWAFVTTVTYFSISIPTPLGGSVSPPGGVFEAGSTVYLTAVPQKNFAFSSWSDQNGFLSAENPIGLVMTQNYSLTANFVVVSYTDDFETGNLSKLPWTTSGAAPWVVQSAVSHSGRFAARSGLIGDGQQTSLILTENMFAGPAAFDYRISSELGYDQLEFFLNGVQLPLRFSSGEVDWQTFQFLVPAGLNTLEWRYVKDANFSAGLDAAFIDNLLVPVNPPDASAAAKLSIVHLPNGLNQLGAVGQEGRGYVIQYSSDLSTWSALATNTITNGVFFLVDTQATAFPMRFYRSLAR